LAAVHLLLAQQGPSTRPHAAQVPATPVAAPWQIMSAVSQALPDGEAEARQQDSLSLPHVQRPPAQVP
jgi:hypothetical protein